MNWEGGLSEFCSIQRSNTDKHDRQWNRLPFLGSIPGFPTKSPRPEYGWGRSWTSWCSWERLSHCQVGKMSLNHTYSALAGKPACSQIRWWCWLLSPQQPTASSSDSKKWQTASSLPQDQVQIFLKTRCQTDLINKIRFKLCPEDLYHYSNLSQELVSDRIDKQSPFPGESVLRPSFMTVFWRSTSGKRWCMPRCYEPSYDVC